MRDIIAAAGQFSAVSGEKQKNIEKILDISQAAKKDQCELIVFPELALTGYLPPAEILSLAEPLDGGSLQKLATGVKKIGISLVLGIPEKDAATDKIYNSAVFINSSGQISGVYRKMQLWSTEKQWAMPGESVTIMTDNNILHTCWICYDIRFPEIARLSALSGAEIACVPTAWLGPQEEWELAVRSRALDNSMFVIGSDLINNIPGSTCYGFSMIAGPTGNILAKAEPGKEGFIKAQLSQKEFDNQRQLVPLFNDRLPHKYKNLCQQ